MTIFEDIKALHEKYVKDSYIDISGEPHFELLESNNSDIALLLSYQEILAEMNNHSDYLVSLYNFFDNHRELLEAEDEDDAEEAPDEAEDTISNDISNSFSEEEDDEETLGNNEETFANKYPEVNEEEILKKVYDEWLTEVQNKPFFKTISAYHQLAQSGTLNFVDRNFLWKLIKAISSCITHLFIEGEQKEESLCLVDKYYDSLINCLNSVVHASSKEDVANAFMYMVDFLGLSETAVSNEDENKDKEDIF